MGTMLKKFSIVFSAGAFGGFVNALCVWFFGWTGVALAFGVKMAPALNEQLIYPKIFWGGVWGIMFLLPHRTKSYILRGLMYSAAPTLVMLFVVFPFWLKKGIMGLSLGSMVPYFVFLYNFSWGVAAALWIKAIEYRDEEK